MVKKECNESDRALVIRELERRYDIRLEKKRRHRAWLRDEEGGNWLVLLAGYESQWYGIPIQFTENEYQTKVGGRICVVVKKGTVLHAFVADAEQFIMVKDRLSRAHTSGDHQFKGYQFNTQFTAQTATRKEHGALAPARLRIKEVPGLALEEFASIAASGRPQERPAPPRAAAPSPERHRRAALDAGGNDAPPRSLASNPERQRQKLPGRAGAAAPDYLALGRAFLRLALETLLEQLLLWTRAACEVLCLALGKASKQLGKVLDKVYESRGRSARMAGNREERERWLRNQYTNEGGQMTCQICKREMPFKKRDGAHHFETVKALSAEHFSTEHNAQFLALCPVCAAQYKEFIRQDDKVMEELSNALINAERFEVPLRLGQCDTSIRFTETHYNDIKTIIEGRSKKVSGRLE